MRQSSRWVAVLLSVLVIACDENPTEPPPPQQIRLLRVWQHNTYRLATGYVDGPWDHLMNGVLFDQVEYGPMVLYPVGWDSIARGEVFSDATGHTYWLSTQTPKAEPGDTLAVLGTETVLQQHHRFRKTEPDASLEFVISGLTLEAMDGNANLPTFGECPWLAPEDRNDPQACETVMLAMVDFSLEALGPTEGDGPHCYFVLYDECFFFTAGQAELRGWRGAWDYDVSAPGNAMEPAWKKGDLRFDPNVGGSAGHATLTLDGQLVIDVPLDRVPLDSLFSVSVEVAVSAHNVRQREAYVGAYFRDPARETGLDFDYTGLVPESVSYREPARVSPSVEPICSAGAGAPGVVQFATTDFGGAEPHRWGRVVVTRSGGSSGALAVRLTTEAGTATAGSDYEDVSTWVLFADGEEGDRLVRIPFLDDATEEDDETVTLSLSNAGGCAVLGGATTATLTIWDDDGPPPEEESYTIGGTVRGLEGQGLVLTNLSTDHLSVDGDGPFTFAREYADGFVYNVRVDTQPTNPGQLCAVTNGSGTLQGADVTDIDVTCETLAPPDGGLDATFGTGGFVTLDVHYTGTQGDAPDVALQDDGKIVVVSGNAIARYNVDGTPDAGFGAGGLVTLDIHGPSHDRLNAVALQPDGRIVVAGYTRDGVNGPTQEDFVLARYEVDGTPDVGFGTDGLVITDFEEHQDIVWDVLIQPDGKIVATGHASTIDQFGFGVYYPDYAAARYTADGALDSTFGTGGKVTTNIAGESEFPYASALQADGMIVLAGRVAPSGGSDPDIGLVRYTAEGQLDLGFGNGGILRNETDAWDEAADVLIQPDGKIVVVGFTLHEGGLVNPAPDTLTIERFNADGSYDASFGNGGRVQSAVMYPGRAVALQPDGGIVVAGVDQTGASADYAVARFHANGAWDDTFGADGLVTVDFFGDLDIANAVVVQPDGRVVVAGSARSGLNYFLGLARIVP
jgi:uncharacterized delta-60 repeat protein